MTPSDVRTDSTTAASPGAVRSTIVAVLGAVAVSLAVYGIARAAGADMLVPGSPGSDEVERLEPAAVVVSSIVPMLIAAGLAIALRRWAPGRGPQIFRIAVLAGLAVSFVPFLASDFSTGTSIALALMHPAVAVIALVFLRPVTAGGSG